MTAPQRPGAGRLVLAGVRRWRAPSRSQPDGRPHSLCISRARGASRAGMAVRGLRGHVDRRGHRGMMRTIVG